MWKLLDVKKIKNKKFLTVFLTVLVSILILAGSAKANYVFYNNDDGLNHFSNGLSVPSVTSSGNLTTAAGVVATGNVTTANSIGIGTAGPGYPLHLYKASAETGILTTWGANSIYISHGGWGLGSGKLGIGSGSLPSLVVDSLNNNIGIGTNSPTGKLNIYEATGTANGASQGSLTVDHGNSGGASSVVFRSLVNRGSDYGYIQYQDASTVGGGGESARLIIGTSNDADDHLALMPAGSVGIGTTNPGYKLDVQGGQINTSGGLCMAGDCKTTWAEVSTVPTFVKSQDGDRNANTKLPTTSPQGVRFDFVGSGSTGTGGTYAGVMTYAPWTGTTASTGDASYQLAFGSSATNGSGIPQLRIRNGIDSTWNSWKTILTDDGSGKVGIGTAAPSVKLQVYGGALRTDLNAAGVSATFTGTGSNLQIKHNGSGTPLELLNSGYTGIYLNGGPVTVGGYDLTVDGTMYSNSGIYAPTVYGGYNSGSYGNGFLGNNYYYSGNETGLYENYNGWPIAAVDYNDNTMHYGWNINSNQGNGYVGINTYPSYPLDVNGTINSAGLCINGDCKSSWSAVNKIGPNSNNPERGAWDPTWSSIASGRALYTDEEFALGTNSVSVYNNSGGNGVQHFWENGDGSQPNSSGKWIRILNNGSTTSPGRGGFVQYINCRRNATFAQRFRAKLPVGYSLVLAENSQGTNNTSYWLTSTAGTGKWEEYIRVSHCGNSGTFSSGGHVYVTGGSSSSFTWYLASSNIYEVDSPPGIFSGNVGIGIANPGYKLDVQDGQINSSGGLCIAGNCKTNWDQVAGTNMVIKDMGTGDFNTSFTSTPADQITFTQQNANGGNNSPVNGTWYFTQNIRHTNGAGYWGTQIAYGWEDHASRMWLRNVTNGTFSGWSEFITSLNIGSQSVASAAKVDGIASNPDNSHPGYGARPFYSWNTGQAKNASSGYSNGITIGSNPGDQSYGFQIVQNMWDDKLYFRRYNAGWQGWYAAVAEDASGNASVTNSIAVGGQVRASSGVNFYGNGYSFSGPGDTDGGMFSPADGTLVFSTNNVEKMRIDPSGSVTMTGTLSVTGAVTAASFQYSDRTLKKNIATIESPLSKILKLRGVTFNWKKDNVASVGLIAQEVEKVFPELVRENEGVKTVQYSNLVAPLIEAVKEQQQEIESLNNRIKALESHK